MADLEHEPHGRSEGNTLVAGQHQHLGRGGGGGGGGGRREGGEERGGEGREGGKGERGGGGERGREGLTYGVPHYSDVLVVFMVMCVPNLF